MSERERFTVRCRESAVESGEVYIHLPEELLRRTGLDVGDSMTIEVIDGVVELRPLPCVAASTWSLGVALREETHRAYRQSLKAHLQIPTDATEQVIHSLIEAGFSASLMQTLCEQGVILPVEQERVIPRKELLARRSESRNLSRDESDRLFRFIHVVAMSEAVFGSPDKARNWLSKPKMRLSGKSPSELLSTSIGTQHVEEMLVRVAEGLYS